MKKIFFALTIICAITLANGCTKTKSDNAAQDNSTKIGIGKIVSHPSLDAIEKGIEDELAASGRLFKIDKQNANGDINTASSIANKFKSEKVDLAVGIATPMAVAIANVIKDKPVVFSGITDPIAANLVENMDNGYRNINGVVDTIPVPEQIREFRKIFPFKKLGFIYASSEANAVSMAKAAEKTCKELGIEFIPATITNTSEIKQAAESLVTRVDAFYITNDNTLVAGVNALIETAKANKIPVFSGDISSSMDGGVVYALGFDYYNLGRATGKMILEILDGVAPSSIPVGILTNAGDYLKLVDVDSAKKLNIALPKEIVTEADFVIENGKTVKK